MKLTRSTVERLSLPAQVAAYFERNLIDLPDNGKRPAGLSQIAQHAFWNNWQQALAEWKETLPTR